MQQNVRGVNNGIRSLASLYDGVSIAERMHRRVELSIYHDLCILAKTYIQDESHKGTDGYNKPL